MPNHLIRSTSPYLLQHAHNPVDWYPWGEEALRRAQAEDKPIFLSIGYAACHWCHVMAHESFEDHQTAELMNTYFVNIKVDREERPDIDSIYMSATVAMNGSGGWPTSIFLTPDLQPFFAGTYFPPTRRYNLPAFREILEAVHAAWQNERGKVLESGQRITSLLQAHTNLSRYELSPLEEHLQEAGQSLLAGYDWGYGGWGTAPKFPQPMSIEFLLRRHVAGDHDTLKAAMHALSAMARGGMYDVIGGGFARYSTDTFWRVPHFEKMLYDNALLARTYLHAWQINAHPAYRHVVEQTLAFISREMTHPDGGFYSSLDADSEGEEGKYYVWTASEIKGCLKEDYDFYQAAFSLSERGNWEGKTVLQRTLDDATLSARFGLGLEAVSEKLADCNARLFAARQDRARPGTDDKVLTAWNGLMLATLAEAARVLHVDACSNSHYEMATRSAGFLLTHLRPDSSLRRSWREGKASGEVFLEDFGALILGLVELYQTDFDSRWFAAAVELADEMIARFQDPAGGFFDTPSDGTPLVIRPRDMQDNAIPSGNALACEALLVLSAMTERSDFRDRAEHSLKSIADAAVRHPGAFARWLSAADFALGPVKQVALLGEIQTEGTREMLRTIRSAYRPNLLVALSSFPPPPEAPGLLANRKQLEGKSTAFVCEGFVCKRPVTSAPELEKLV